MVRRLIFVLLLSMIPLDAVGVLNFIQEDTGSGNTNSYSSCTGDVTGPGSTGAKVHDPQGTQGSTEETITMPVQATPRLGVSFWSPSDEPNDDNWESGDYVVRLDVTSGSMNINIAEVWILRITTGSSCSTVASDTGLSISISTATTYSRTMSGSSQPSASTTDRLWIAWAFQNLDEMKTQDFGFTPDVNNDTPLVVGAAAPTPRRRIFQLEAPRLDKKLFEWIREAAVPVPAPPPLAPPLTGRAAEVCAAAINAAMEAN